MGTSVQHSTAPPRKKNHWSVPGLYIFIFIKKLIFNFQKVETINLKINNDWFFVALAVLSHTAGTYC